MCGVVKLFYPLYLYQSKLSLILPIPVKISFGKMVPGTSNNWPYHTDLLVFCLTFKLSPVCEYLNYYYNITNDCWAIPEKSKQGGLRTYFFKKNLNFLGLSLFRFVSKKSFLYNWKFFKIVLHPLETPKTKTHVNSTKLFSWKFCKIL